MAGKSLDTRLQKQNQQKELAKSKLEQKQYELQYEALSCTNKHRRRQPKIERGTEDAQYLDGRNRLKAIGVSRQLLRDSAIGRAIIENLKANSVNTGSKVKFHLADKAQAKEYERFINSTWAKSCDLTGRFNFFELQSIAIQEMLTAGDCLAYFDSETGKLRLFEAEQLKKISDWEDKETAQVDGVIHSIFDGRVKWYAISGERDVEAVKRSSATLLEADDCSLIFEPFRYSSYRGVPKLLALQPLLDDLRQYQLLELQAAKVNASFAAAIKRNDSANIGLARSGQTVETADSSYPNLEALYGGHLVYMEPNESLDLLSNNRPNANIGSFFEFAATLIGSACSLPLSHTLLKTNTSYSAARNEANQAKVVYGHLQKVIERRFLDFAVKKAVQWGIDNGLLSQAENWQNAFSFNHYQIAEIDTLRTAKALESDLNNGIQNLQDQYSDWEARLEQRKKEMDKAKELGIELPWLNPDAQLSTNEIEDSED